MAYRKFGKLHLDFTPDGLYFQWGKDGQEKLLNLGPLNRLAGDRVFGFCLDTGHLLLVGGDIKNTMVKLGDRICAFHVHDNNGITDQHLAPYMGVQDWDAFVDGLRAIGYNKTMSFETFNVWNTVDKELCPTMLKYIAQAGRMFAARAQA